MRRSARPIPRSLLALLLAILASCGEELIVPDDATEPQQLRFAIQPSSAEVGSRLVPAIEVEVTNSGGVRLESASGSVELVLLGGTGGATLVGETSEQLSRGLARFTDLSVDQVGSAYTLSASSASRASMSSEPFDVEDIEALRFVTAPSVAVRGLPFDPVVEVEIIGSGGSRLEDAVGTILLELSGGPSGAALTGETTAEVERGLARFPDLRVTPAGSDYLLKASSSERVAASTDPFRVEAPRPVALRVSALAASLDLDRTLPQVVVEALDNSGELFTEDVTVEVVIATGPDGAELSGTTARLAQGGTARFDDLSFSASGDYALTFRTGPVAETSEEVAVRFRLRQIAAGALRTCGVTPSFALYCWGRNSDGLLGDGSAADRYRPVRIVEGRAFNAVTVGTRHQCALSGRRAFCWGDNGLGQLGVRDTSPRPLPTEVAFGTYTGIDVGTSHTCALTAAGELRCWGAGGDGQLRLGRRGPDTASPLRVDLEGVFNFAVGSEHTCAVAGIPFELHCFGANTFDALGEDDGLGVSYVVMEESPAGNPIQSVGAGSSMTCGLSNGDIYCWGVFNVGEGIVRSERTHWGGPRVTSFDHSVGNHVCGVTGSREIWCAGGGFWGQLGHGDAPASSRAVQVTGDHEWRSVATGFSHTCALSLDLEPFCWGSNNQGALGAGIPDERSMVPVRVADPEVR